MECVNSCKIRKRQLPLEHFASGQTVPRWQIFPENHLNVLNIPPEPWFQPVVWSPSMEFLAKLQLLMFMLRGGRLILRSIDEEDQDEEERVVCGHNNGSFLLWVVRHALRPLPPPSPHYESFFLRKRRKTPRSSQGRQGRAKAAHGQ